MLFLMLALVELLEGLLVGVSVVIGLGEVTLVVVTRWVVPPLAPLELVVGLPPMLL